MTLEDLIASNYFENSSCEGFDISIHIPNRPFSEYQIIIITFLMMLTGHTNLDTYSATNISFKNVGMMNSQASYSFTLDTLDFENLDILRLMPDFESWLHGANVHKFLFKIIDLNNNGEVDTKKYVYSFDDIFDLDFAYALYQELMQIYS